MLFIEYLGKIPGKDVYNFRISGGDFQNPKHAVAVIKEESMATDIIELPDDVIRIIFTHVIPYLENWEMLCVNLTNFPFVECRKENVGNIDSTKISQGFYPYYIVNYHQKIKQLKYIQYH